MILFNPSASTQIGGLFPAHGATGAGHIAFVVPAEERDAWRLHLERHNIEIEAVVDWPEGGQSLYVRDPAGNSVELAPPTIWGGLGRDLILSTSLPGGDSSVRRDGIGGTP